MIPARLGSSRLPRKPLHPLAGRPLIAWVWDRVSEMDGLDDAVVATDDEEVVKACVEAGARVVMTDPAHPSGTDRVAEVAARPEYADFSVIANVQGDEPLMDGAHVQAAVALVRDSGWDVGTCATAIRTAAEWRDPAVVKVVQGDDGRALYFSRAPIPAVRDGEPGPDDFGSATSHMPRAEASGDPRFLRHIGLYAYSREALLRWVALPPAGLEMIERLEQLRPLAAGLSIGVSVVDRAAPGVDTPEDAAIMDARLRDLTLHRS